MSRPRRPQPSLRRLRLVRPRPPHRSPSASPRRASRTRRPGRSPRCLSRATPQTGWPPRPASHWATTPVMLPGAWCRPRCACASKTRTVQSAHRPCGRRVQPRHRRRQSGGRRRLRPGPPARPVRRDPPRRVRARCRPVRRCRGARVRCRRSRSARRCRRWPGRAISRRTPTSAGRQASSALVAVRWVAFRVLRACSRPGSAPARRSSHVPLSPGAATVPVALPAAIGRVLAVAAVAVVARGSRPRWCRVRQPRRRSPASSPWPKA